MRIAGIWLGIGKGGGYVGVGRLVLDFGMGGWFGLGIVQIIHRSVHVGVWVW